MASRIKNRALVYLRRSSNRQELSLGGQLEWAMAEATKLGVFLNASLADLEYMQQVGLSALKDIRLDDAISGASMDRPGFLALNHDALADSAISHVLINRRDRFGRPDEAMQLAMVEKTLRLSGITIVFCSEHAEPYEPGQASLPDDVSLLLEYHQSGEFLRTLAERVINSHRALARGGYRTGGNPVYGHVRILVDSHGKEIQELPPGRRVRQAGCHVRQKPQDVDKIKIWILILDLKHKGWGAKRIAQHLNALGIQSPDAGRIRRDHGVRHMVSGKWSARTVLELCRNAAIIGMQDYGRRSEGTHRRLGADGPRVLSDGDRTKKGKPRIIHNEKGLTTRVKIDAGQYEPDKWNEIQEELERRGKCQRGIPRVHDPAKYPLACRIIDMTDNSGSVLYARTKDKRRLYVCGRYLKTAGAECENNSVDAEAMLKLTLSSIIQIVDQQGGMPRLRQLIEERARQDRANIPADSTERKWKALQSQQSELRRKIESAGDRMVEETDRDRYEAIAKRFDKFKSEFRDVGRQLEELERCQNSSVDFEAEIGDALGLLERIESACSDDGARADLKPVLDALGLRIGLQFTEGLKGPKRRVRQLVGGLFAFGGAELPVRLHGRNRVDDAPGRAAPPTAEHLVGVGNPQVLGDFLDPQNYAANNELSHPGATEGKRFVDPSANECPPGPFSGHQEGISFSKGNRGDRI